MPNIETYRIEVYFEMNILRAIKNDVQIGRKTALFINVALFRTESENQTKFLILIDLNFNQSECG
jgi:hypothetical protein